MASPDDLITLPRLREGLGIVGDSQDSNLSAYRSAALGYIERYTGRSILNREGWESEESDFEYKPRMTARWTQEMFPDGLFFRISDIQADSEVTLLFSNEDDDPAGKAAQSEQVAVSSARVNLFHDGILIYPDPDHRAQFWSDRIRLEYPVPRLICNRGMPAGIIPAEWGSAAELIVRAIFDGSAYDAMDTRSALGMLLAPFGSLTENTTRR